MFCTECSISDNGRWSIPIPWDRAEEFRAALLAEGIPCIACWEPIGHKSRLELLPDADHTRALALIETSTRASG